MSTKVININAFPITMFGIWLFTIGFAKLTGWAVIWAIVTWPYYLGVLAASYR